MPSAPSKSRYLVEEKLDFPYAAQVFTLRREVTQMA